MAIETDGIERTDESHYEVSPLTSDADTDYEDDPVTKQGGTLTEIAHHDRGVLEEEEEREKLLGIKGRPNASQGFLGRRFNEKQSGGSEGNDNSRKMRRSRKRRRKQRESSHDEEGELMYEMEEGGPKSDISSQASSSSIELDKTNMGLSFKTKVSSTQHIDVG